MVNKLQFLRSLTPGNSPAALSVGEIAFNLSDKKLFVGNGSSTITRLDGTTESVANGTGYFETDLSLVSANAYTDQKIADLVDSAPALLDTLNELAAAIGDDANFVTTVTNSVATVQSNLDAEAARATAAEGVLTADLATEVARATAAEGVLTADLATEVARATAAEGVLQSNIDSEASTRSAADSALAADLATEVARAQAAESSIQSAGAVAIASEEARAMAAESSLNSRISAIEDGIDLGTF